jgi:hypothetical protein
MFLETNVPDESGSIKETNGLEDVTPDKQEDMVNILYNNHYGGFGISKQALTLFNERKSALDPCYRPIKHNYNDYKLASKKYRKDPILIDVYKELGAKKFNGYHASMKLQQIPKRYEHSFTISEYDGLEEIHIDIKGYIISNIQHILTRDMSCDDKIEAIETIIASELGSRDTIKEEEEEEEDDLCDMSFDTDEEEG